MKKFTNKKGFTIMEMLIVVAIIAVLVAIAIPTFSSSLTKAKEATDVANIRAAYAEMQVDMLTDSNEALPKDFNDFKTEYCDGVTFNYVTDGTTYAAGTNNFTYAVTGSKSTAKATLTYQTQALDGGKIYTWTADNINGKDVQ